MSNFRSYFASACHESQGEISDLKEVLSQFCQDQDWLDELHSHVGDEEETLLYCNDTLTLVHARLTPNIHFPPHEHGMTAAIATYDGVETHHLYKEAGDRLQECGKLVAEALDVCVLGPSAIHSIVNPGDCFSRSVHVYLGDLIHRPRRLWNHDATKCVNYHDDEYYAWSRPYKAAQPFHRPKQASLCSCPEAALRVDAAI